MRSALLLAAALFALPALAQPVLPDPDTEVAARRFAVGAEFYRRQQYEDAIREFEAARKLAARPLLDYNIARCLDRLGRWTDAADAYERFLDAAPGAPEAREVHDRVVVLRRRVAEESPRTVPVVAVVPVPAVRPVPAAVHAPPPVPVKAPSRWRWWAGGAVGVAVMGGVAVGLGVGLSGSEGTAMVPMTDYGHFDVRFP